MCKMAMEEDFVTCSSCKIALRQLSAKNRAQRQCGQCLKDMANQFTVCVYAHACMYVFVMDVYDLYMFLCWSIGT